MGVFTITMGEFTSTVAPARLFQAFCMDNHNFLPKVAPELVKSVDFVEGDSTTVGCIKRINFPDGAPFKYLENRMEEIDPIKLYFKYTCIGGDALPATVESVVFENKLEASGTGTGIGTGTGTGTYFKVVAHYHTKGDHVITEEDVSHRKETNKKMFKTVQDYLIANPQLYA